MDTQKSFESIQALRAVGVMVGIMLVIFLGVLTWNEIKKHDYIGKTDAQTYTIAISGEGKVTAAPDIAEISLGLITDNRNVGTAQKENTDKVNQIIAKLGTLGVEKKDIQTSNYSIYPQYDYSNGQQVLRSYQVSQSVNVKIRDLEKVGTIVETAGSLGANQVSGLSFTIDDPEALRQEAREKALVSAKEKAESLAKAAGVKLGKLVSFNESIAGGTSPMPYYRGEMDVKNEAMDAVAPQIEPGSQDIIVNVSVTYEVL